MNIYVFGNEDLESDALAFKVAKELSPKFPEIKFITIKPNEDLPFDNGENVVLMDTVIGIKDPLLLDDTALDKLSTSARSSVHDYDLGFQLKYLKKLGKLGRVKILALPMLYEMNDASIVIIENLVRSLAVGAIKHDHMLWVF